MFNGFMILLLCLTVISVVAAVFFENLIKSAICLSATSVFLTIILFMLGAPWAAVFELSVCAGLITVVFIGSISLTAPYDKEAVTAHGKARLKRFMPLPFILGGLALIAGAALLGSGIDILPPAGVESTFEGFRNILWNTRQTDVLGQIILVLTGVFAVVVLFKESEQE